MYHNPTFENHSAVPTILASPLVDNHGRRVTYLRLAITDRCNLRCRYCMPPEGVSSLHEDDILSFREIERLTSIFTSLGVSKVRITGGEPFVRKQCLQLIRRLKKRAGVEQICLTTNGVLVEQHLEALREIGVSTINLSLDTLCRSRFKEITGSDNLNAVLGTFYGAIKHDISLKINSVVCEDTTDEEMKALAALVARGPVSVRFIEKMGFSGKANQQTTASLNLQERVLRLYPDLQECEYDGISTARYFFSPRLMGTIGIIEGHSRKFCLTCNKIRITPQGILKMCLYDNGVLNLRQMLRSGQPDENIISEIIQAIGKKHADGRIAERAEGCTWKPSMASIGG